MRIIAGEYKGRRLMTPENSDIRPTSDKVREAIFNLLMYDIEGAVCADVFSGTGSLGLEALSRGADFCWFSDNDRKSIALIKANIAACKAEDRAQVTAGDYMKGFRRIDGKIDIFFIDPPYGAGLYEKCFAEIENLDLLSEDGIIVAEHDSRTELPHNTGRLTMFRERRYGKILVSLYSKAGMEDMRD